MTYGKKPIMSAALEAQVINAVIQYSKKQQWKQWGLHNIKKAGAAILLHGPPGCGKTKIAEYLAIKVRRKGIKELAFADFGSQVPGENSRQIRHIFKDARDNGLMTIHINECDALLWDRNEAGDTAKWMLEIINEILVQIEKYEGLTILSTNLVKIIDEALYRRLIATILVDYPEAPERIKLWKDKLPEQFPLKLSIDELSSLATLQISGAEIENAIIDYASECIRTDKKPKFHGLQESATKFYSERIARTNSKRDEKRN